MSALSRVLAVMADVVLAVVAIAEVVGFNLEEGVPPEGATSLCCGG